MIVTLFNRLLTLSICLLGFTNIAYSQFSNAGNDFWVMFNSNVMTEIITLQISSLNSTSGIIEIPGLSFSEEFSSNPSETTTINLPSNAEVNSNDLIENLGIHITSDDNIVVSGLTHGKYTSDAFTAFPTISLGSEYLIMSYSSLSSFRLDSQFGIVGTENDTHVKITPSTIAGPGNIRKAGIPYEIILQKGDVYQLKTEKSNLDLTGTELISNKPIAVFGSHECALIPTHILSCDHLVEQLSDVTTWGKTFLTSALLERFDGDIFRVLTSKDDTQITINGTIVNTINRGDYYEFDLPSGSFNEIKTNWPVFLAQFSKSTLADSVESDPFMMTIAPIENYSGSSIFSTPSTLFTENNFINIIIRDEGKGILSLDGVVFPTSDYTSIGTTGFSGIRRHINEGSHILECTVPFGASVYGYSHFDSYGYSAGQLLSPIAEVTNLSIDPHYIELDIPIQHCISATITDDKTHPLEGIRVDFEISGVNSELGFAITDKNGIAKYCYTGEFGGIDNIIVSTGDLSEMAQANWSNIAVPVMGEWGLLILFLLLCIFGYTYIHKETLLKA